MARLSTIGSLSCTMVLVLTVVTPAMADLVLTPAGVADGFTLTEFVGGYNFGATYGPLAQGILPNGNVVTGSVGDHNIYIFPDTDGQTLGSAVSKTPYASQTGNPNWAMATAGGQVYGAQLQGNGIYEHFANDGSFTPIPNLQAAGLFGNLGMWGDPVNGHLIAASNKGLVDIDPVAGTFRVINGALFPDGVTVSPDGTVAYVAIAGVIQSYSIATGALLHTYATGHSPDGTGVISGGTFNGDVIVNNNDGTVGLLDPITSQFTIIADNGTRGDFVSADVSNGTLFLSQFESVDRLSCGPGCSIGGGGGGPTVPEPSTWLMLATGLVGLGGLAWRRHFRS